MDKKLYSLFYDTGCCDMVSIAKSISSRAVQESSMQISIGGVGNSMIKTNHGIFQVQLPLFNGADAVFNEVHVGQITLKFPHYPLKGKVQDDNLNSCKQHGGNPTALPKLPQFVGGHTDLMLEIKYIRYYPEKVFQFPSGLTTYVAQRC